jgi:hypothetical protein
MKAVSNSGVPTRLLTLDGRLSSPPIRRRVKEGGPPHGRPADTKAAGTLLVFP